MKLDLPLPKLLGRGVVYLQYFVIDAAAGNGLFTATNGLELRLL